MKKPTIFISILLLGAVLLSACSTNGTESAVEAVAESVSDTIEEVEAQVSAAQSNAQTDSMGTIDEFSMPLAMQLVLGTFKLEESDYPVTDEQAQELLTLWKAARSLSESDTTAAEEIEALVNQIRDSMTAEQLQAIEAMDLTFEDMAAIFEELGLEFGGAGRFEEMTPEMQATMEAMRASGESPRGGPGGEFPGGGPGVGPGGGFGGEGGQLSPEARETLMAERGGIAQAGARLGLNPALLDAVIEFLQAKVE